MARFQGTTSKGVNYIYDTKPSLSDDLTITRASAWESFALGWIDKAKNLGTLKDIENVKNITKKLTEPFIFGNINFNLEEFNKKYTNIKSACSALSSIQEVYNEKKNLDHTL